MKTAKEFGEEIWGGPLFTRFTRFLIPIHISLLAETLAHQTGVQIGRSEVARWNRTDRRPFRWTFRGRWRTVPVALAA
jgi:hypothetical protein